MKVLNVFAPPRKNGLFIAIALLWLTANPTHLLFGQVPSVNLSCNQLLVEICPAYDAAWGLPNSPLNPPPPNCHVCGQVDCRHMQYSIDLVVNNYNPTGNFALSYKALSLAIGLSFNSSASVRWSRIDAAATNACLGDYGHWMSVDAASSLVSLDIHGSSPFGEAQPTILFTNIGGNYRAHLFNIVVEAFPGETITAECISTLYEPGNQAYACSYPPPPPPNTSNLFLCTTPTTTSVNVPVPPSTAGLVCIEFDAANPVEYNPVDFLPTIPVYLNSMVTVPSQLESADFLIDVQSQNPIETPEIVADPAFAPYIKSTRVLPVPNTNDYRIYILLEDLVLNQGQISKMFDLKIHNPMNSSLAGMVHIGLLPGRETGVMNNLPVCGQSCVDSDILDVCYPGYPMCGSPDNFKFDVIGQPVAGQCDSRVFLGMKWDSPGIFKKFWHMKLELEFQTTGDLTSDAISNNALKMPPCSDCNNPLNPIPGCNDNSWFGCGTDAPLLEWANNRLTICFDNPTSGSDSKIEWNNQGAFALELNGINGCVTGVIVRQAEVGFYDENTDVRYPVCAAEVVKSGLPACASTRIAGNIVEHFNLTEAVENVEVRFDALTPAPAITCGNLPCVITNCNLPGFSVCANGADNPYKIRPYLNSNPLNGVSTFDLVEMSKHILGVKPFTSPFQFIAADINKNNQVSTFDIVELRKLILGVNTVFPANTSWRFHDKSVFLSLSAFQPTEFISFDISAPPSSADFIAIKIGDLNNDHINDCPSFLPPFPTQKQLPYLLKIPAEKQSENLVVVPVMAGGNESMLAFQAGFQFDPTKWEFLGPAQGNVNGLVPSCFGLNKLNEGIIKLIWLSPDMDTELLAPGKTLCYFTFKSKKGPAIGSPLSLLVDGSFESLAISTTDQAYSIQPESAEMVESRSTIFPSNLPQIACLPNPTGGEFMLKIEAPADDFGRFYVFDPFGVRVAYREIKLAKGVYETRISEAANWVPGLYSWVFVGKNGRQDGRVVRQ